MDLWIRIAWAALALVHLPPAAVLARPSLVNELYGAAATGSAGLLLLHRGVAFLGVVAVSVLAALDPASRRAASLVVGPSVLGFLWLYLRAGMPPGPLRSIAWVDAAALVPLAAVLYHAWHDIPAD